MSSCRRCGSCTKYFETPSGKCDYCDCPYADHTSTPGRSGSFHGFDSMQSSMQPQQPMGIQQMHPSEMPYVQTGFQGPAQFGHAGIPMSPVSPMQPPFMQQQAQFGQMNQFYAPPLPFQQFTPYGGGMPMMPPNSQSSPYLAKNSCRTCGVVLAPAAVNRDMLCVTCLQNKPPSRCTRCKANNANPGYSWCQACFESDDKCRKCNKNSPNEGFKWCESCYQGQQQVIDCVPPVEAAASPLKACPSCKRQRYFDIKEKKLFDFCGQTCAQQHYAASGVLKLDKDHEDFLKIDKKFKKNWNKNKGPCPPITAVFKVKPNGADAKFEAYRKTLRGGVDKIEHYFHGCKITCDLLNANCLCIRADCTICLVSRQGFDIRKVGTNVAFTRFGRGLYFAPESSKCHDYTLGTPACGYRAMFFVKCAPGFKQVEFTDDQKRIAPDKGYNSLYGHAGGSLNYDELCLYTDHACVPDCIIIYNRDGVDKRCL